MVDALTGGTARPDHFVVQSNRSTHIPTPRYGSSVAALGRDGGLAATGNGAATSVVVVAGRVVGGVVAIGIAPGRVVAFGSKTVGPAETVVAGKVITVVGAIVEAIVEVVVATVDATRVVDTFRRFVVVDLFGFLADFLRVVDRATFFEDGAAVTADAAETSGGTATPNTSIVTTQTTDPTTERLRIERLNFIAPR